MPIAFACKYDKNKCVAPVIPTPTCLQCGSHHSKIDKSAARTRFVAWIWCV